MVTTRTFGRKSFGSARSSMSSRVSRSGMVPVSARKADLKQASNIQKLLKRTKGLTPELKICDAVITFTSIDNSVGGIVALTGIAQGDTVFTRTGNRVMLKSIDINLTVSTILTTSLPVSTDTQLGFRWFVVRDMQQIADSAFTVGDVFESTSDVHRPIPQQATKGRFRILYDSGFQSYSRIWPVGVGDLLLSAPTQMPFRRFKKFGLNIPVQFNGTASTDIQKNGLSIIVISNSNADTADFNGNSRIHFTDV